MSSESAGVFYPITLTDLGGKSAVVIGGGRVGERKVFGLLEAGVDVTVISPEVSEQLEDLVQEKRIQLKRRKYRQGDCRGEALVFAATDDNEINSQIAQEAHEMGVHCNVASDPGLCTFHLPAVYRGSDVLVTVSSYGLNPVSAKRLRDQIADWIEADDGR